MNSTYFDQSCYVTNGRFAITQPTATGYEDNYGISRVSFTYNRRNQVCLPSVPPAPPPPIPPLPLLQCRHQRLPPFLPPNNPPEACVLPDVDIPTSISLVYADKTSGVYFKNDSTTLYQLDGPSQGSQYTLKASLFPIVDAITIQPPFTQTLSEVKVYVISNGLYVNYNVLRLIAFGFDEFGNEMQIIQSPSFSGGLSYSSLTTAYISSLAATEYNLVIPSTSFASTGTLSFSIVHATMTTSLQTEHTQHPSSPSSITGLYLELFQQGAKALHFNSYDSFRMHAFVNTNNLLLNAFNVQITYNSSVCIPVVYAGTSVVSGNTNLTEFTSNTLLLYLHPIRT